MKKNYYELQIRTFDRGFITISAYNGTRSNANRKFRYAIDSMIPNPYSQEFLVCTYKSLNSMLSGESPVRRATFNY